MHPNGKNKLLPSEVIKSHRMETNSIRKNHPGALKHENSAKINKNPWKPQTARQTNMAHLKKISNDDAKSQITEKLTQKGTNCLNFDALKKETGIRKDKVTNWPTNSQITPEKKMGIQTRRSKNLEAYTKQITPLM